MLVQQAPSFFMFAFMQSTHKTEGERRRNVGLIDMREVKSSNKCVRSSQWLDGRLCNGFIAIGLKLKRHNCESVEKIHFKFKICSF